MKDKKIYHHCTICNIKTFDWEKHIKTKRHLKKIKDIPYDERIINSHIGCKYTPCLQFLPKVKFNINKDKYQWRTK